MTLVESPALDLVIASLTGRGRFGRRPKNARLKNFQKNSPGPKDYLPTSPHIYLLPSPYLLNITPSTPRVWSCSFPCETASFCIQRERERCHRRHRSSSEQQTVSLRNRLQPAFFFFGHSSSSTSSLVPAPTVCPSSQSARRSTHQICLPGLPRDFVSCVCCRLDPTTPGQTAPAL